MVAGYCRAKQLYFDYLRGLVSKVSYKFEVKSGKKMGRHCFVCKKTDYLYPQITFHRFPTDLQIKRNYFEILQIHGEVPRRALICSDHFMINDFQFRGITQVKVLKKESLPLPYGPIGDDPLSTFDSTINRTPKRRVSSPNISLVGFDDDNQSSSSKKLKLEHSDSSSTLTGSGGSCEKLKYILRATPPNMSLVDFEDDNKPSCSKKLKLERSDSSTTLTGSEGSCEKLIYSLRATPPNMSLVDFEDDNKLNCSKKLKLERCDSSSTLTGSEGSCEKLIYSLRATPPDMSLVDFEDDNKPNCSKKLKLERSDSSSRLTGSEGSCEKLTNILHHEEDGESLEVASISSSTTLTATSGWVLMQKFREND